MHLRSCLLVLLLASAGCGGAAAEGGSNGSKVDSFSLRKQLAFALIAHHEWAAASKTLLELRAERPTDAEIHVALGTVFREQGLFEQAEASFGAAIRIDPKNARAYVGRGILREVRRDAGDAAVEDFRTGIRLLPEPAFYNNLGFALYVRGRFNEAVAAFQDGLMGDPFSRRMRTNLGFAYGRLGQIDRAKREFEHSGREDEVENNLGLVHEQAGNVDAACEHYRRSIEKNPLLTVAVENEHRVCAPEEPSARRSP